ncbi:class I SAM-dependent methyltransferase [Kocuria sp. KH4]
MARLLELDARIHAPLLSQARSLLTGATGTAHVWHVLDIGAGTGTGAVALAHAFPAAQVVAVDIDGDMLEQVRRRAQASGVDQRIVTLRADIAAASPSLGRADVAWSSAALHEVSDPDLAVTNLFEALEPGGVLAVLEMDVLPTVLPPAHAELEERVHAAGGGAAATDHPEWTGTMTAAGFEMLLTRQLTTDVELPADGPAGDYAALVLRRLGHAAMRNLQDADRTTLMPLAGE